jgi:LysR family transcriptional regulator, glycine cleavage system transcriptional activator
MEEPPMRRSLPPLNALRSFDAAARHQSFTRAADELCVTQGAVSHQVKALEAELGLKLFNRARQGLAITEAGRDYLAVVQDAFDRIALGTDRLLQRQRAGVITVSTSPDFAAKWLVNRLGRFAEAHPEIELKVSAAMQHVDSRGKRSIWRSATVPAIGRVSTRSIYARRSCFRFAALPS